MARRPLSVREEGRATYDAQGVAELYFWLAIPTIDQKQTCNDCTFVIYENTILDFYLPSFVTTKNFSLNL